MKQPKRLTRAEKIAAGKEKRAFKPAKPAEGALQAELLKAGLADLTSRVEALEAPKVVEQKPQGRPQRDFIGKKEKTE
ncbi:hypothetical protein RCTITAN_50 [Rhodobacter phage RcTitan]|uniref:Uncharacterized protein n=1 Tax=Rhodobacter phage RcTitan TaxID=1662330 RepID=A0A0K1LKN6_9CAUD|nr:hypothetical protein RCTITAN_50 [Rhodobacter phage RcTitan]AKU43066.1 hypothetical protein RCTITAN_50 [Rhodobacter phage RcTitan]